MSIYIVLTGKVGRYKFQKLSHKKIKSISPYEWLFQEAAL
jgi:hypothetical protein